MRTQLARSANILALLILTGSAVCAQTIRKDSADRELKYYWDRNQSAWELEEQWDFEFDSSGYLLSSSFVYFDTEGAVWRPWSKEIIHYDSIGRIYVAERHNWLPEESIWLPYLFDERYVSSLYITPAKTEYFYDRDGYAKEEIMYGWDRPDSTYFNSARRTLMTDAFGNETDLAEYSWDSALGDWDMETRLVQLRDSQGRVLERIGYEKENWWSEDPDPIRPMTRWVYELDSAGNQLSMKYYDYNTDLSDWQISREQKFSYDTAGNTVERNTYERLSEANDLVLTRREAYAYDADGNMLYENNYFLSDPSGELMIVDSTAFEYDPVGNLLSVSVYMTDMNVPGEFNPVQRNSFQYDASGNLTEDLYYDYASAEWVPVYKTNWNFDLQGTEISRYSYYWHDQEEEWQFQNGDSLWLSLDDNGRVMERMEYDYFSDNGWIPRYWRMKYWPDDLIRDQDFFVAENNQEGEVAGSILLGSGFDLSMVEMEISSADPAGLASLDEADGAFRILALDSYDYERIQVIDLVVNVRDLKDGSSDSARISIKIMNLNDNAPQLWDTVFTVAEDVGSPGELGTIRIEDPDGNLNWTELLIVDGNEEDIFLLDSYLKVLFLQRPELLDYDTRPFYELTVTAFDGVFTTEGTVTIQVLDVEEITGLADLPPEVKKIYPNPSGGTLYLKLNADTYQVRIHSATGRLVLEGEVYGPSAQIDISSLESGIYFITLSTENFTWTGRVARH